MRASFSLPSSGNNSFEEQDSYAGSHLAAHLRPDIDILALFREEEEEEEEEAEEDEEEEDDDEDQGQTALEKEKELLEYQRRFAMGRSAQRATLYSRELKLVVENHDDDDDDEESSSSPSISMPRSAPNRLVTYCLRVEMGKESRGGPEEVVYSEVILTGEQRPSRALLRFDGREYDLANHGPGENSIKFLEQPELPIQLEILLEATIFKVNIDSFAAHSPLRLEGQPKASSSTTVFTKLPDGTVQFKSSRSNTRIFKYYDTHQTTVNTVSISSHMVRGQTCPMFKIWKTDEPAASITETTPELAMVHFSQQHLRDPSLGAQASAKINSGISRFFKFFDPDAQKKNVERAKKKAADDEKKRKKQQQQQQQKVVSRKRSGGKKPPNKRARKK